MSFLIIIPEDKEGVKRHIFSCLDTTRPDAIDMAGEEDEDEEEEEGR